MFESCTWLVRSVLRESPSGLLGRPGGLWWAGLPGGPPAGGWPDGLLPLISLVSGPFLYRFAAALRQFDGQNKSSGVES